MRLMTAKERSECHRASRLFWKTERGKLSIANDMGRNDDHLGGAARKHTMLGPEAKYAATTLDRIHARPVDEPLGCNRWGVE
jgi:hypothetical protein